MDVGRAIGAPFKDQKWFAKAAWAGLWSTIPFTGFAVTGYTIDYIRNVANGVETPLPEWTGNFGRYWVRGVLAAIALAIYMLPALVLIGIGTIPLIGAAISSAQNAYGSDAGSSLAALGSGTLCLTTFIAVLYMVAVSFLWYAAMTNYAFSESFGALFAFREIRERMRTGSGYALAWIMSVLVFVVVGSIASVVGSVLAAVVVGTVLLPFVYGAVGFVGGVVSSHLFGQYAASAYGLPGLPPVVMPTAPTYPAPAQYAAPPVPSAPQAPPVAPQAPPAPPVAPTEAPAPPAPPVAPTEAPAPPAPPAPPVAPTEAPAPPAPPVPPTPPTDDAASS